VTIAFGLPVAPGFRFRGKDDSIRDDTEQNLAFASAPLRLSSGLPLWIGLRRDCGVENIRRFRGGTAGR
jgi:hypothetical protein